MSDDLRDQIAAAMRESVRAGRIGFDNIATAVEAVVQAAITEARREALLSAADDWDRIGRTEDSRREMDDFARAHYTPGGPSMPTLWLRARAAGEHDTGLGASGATSKSDPSSLGTSADPVVAQVAAGEHDTPAGEPSPAAGERHAFEDTDRARLSDDELTWLGVCARCGGDEDDPIHTPPAQQPATAAMVEEATRRHNVQELRPQPAAGGAHTCDERLGRNGCTSAIHGPPFDPDPALAGASPQLSTPPAQRQEWHEYSGNLCGGFGGKLECWTCGEPRNHPNHRPPPAQQPAGPDVDSLTPMQIASIRASAERGEMFAGWEVVLLCDSVSNLCDALEARDAEIERLRADLDDFRQSLVGEEAETDRLEAEIRELRAEVDTVSAVLRSQTDNVIATEKLADGLAAQRDDARARLDEIRALCDDEDARPGGPKFGTEHIREILDREAGR